MITALLRVLLSDLPHALMDGLLTSLSLGNEIKYGFDSYGSKFDADGHWRD